MEALMIPLAMFLVLAVCELARPGRDLPRVRHWHLKGVLGFVVFAAVSVLAPMFWDGWLGEHRLMDASGLGTWGGALAGLLVYELFQYAWHRSLHNVSWLWRWFHQMHHSAERVDVFGAFYFHPFDMLGFVFVGSFSLVWVLGVTPEAAALANLVSTFCAMFQHTNLRTPRWLGYLVHRPENHALHHQRGVHAHNYGNLAIWDLVFGTFRNPATWDAQAGLYDGASARVGDMLLGRDVSEPPAPERASEPQPALS